MNPRVRLILAIGFVGVFVVAFGIYGLYRARGFMDGPKLTITSPQDGQIVQNSNLEIKGQAENISMIFLNGGQIFTDENGFFEENLLLARGYNIIEVKVEDKFNREVKINRRIVLK